MVAKQIAGSNQAPDGSQYVTITDGAGNLTTANTSSPATTVTTPGDALANTANVSQTELSLNYVYNGTTWDRCRNVGGAIPTTNAGILASVSVPNTSANAGVASVASTAVAAAQVVKASACNLYSVSCTSGASAGFLMVFDATAAPADGAVTPADVITVAANSTVYKTYAVPVRCATGATLVFSTTGPFTKTASTTAFLAGQAV